MHVPISGYQRHVHCEQNQSRYQPQQKPQRRETIWRQSNSRRRLGLLAQESQAQ